MCIAIATTEPSETILESAYEAAASAPLQVIAGDPVLTSDARRLIARRKCDAAISLATLAQRLRAHDPKRHAALMVMLAGGALG